MAKPPALQPPPLPPVSPGRAGHGAGDRKSSGGSTTVNTINTMSSSGAARGGRAGPPRAGPSSVPERPPLLGGVTAGSHGAWRGDSHEKGKWPGVRHAAGAKLSRSYCSNFGTSTCQRRHPVTGGSWERGKGTLGWHGGPGADLPWWSGTLVLWLCGVLGTWGHLPLGQAGCPHTQAEGQPGQGHKLG